MGRKRRQYGSSDAEHERWAKEELEWANYQLGVAEKLISGGSNYCQQAYEQLMGARESGGSYLAHVGRGTQNPAITAFGPKGKKQARARAAAEGPDREPPGLMDPAYRTFRERYAPLADTFKKICATPAWKMPGEDAPPPSPKTPKAQRVDAEVQRASQEPVEPPIPRVKREPRERPPRITRRVVAEPGTKCRIRLVSDSSGCTIEK